MAEIRTFCAVHPAEGLASKLAALPYDVYSRDEAREQVKKVPESFLAIDRPETQFPKDQDMYAPEVYQKAHDMLGNGSKEAPLCRISRNVTICMN